MYGFYSVWSLRLSDIGRLWSVTKAFPLEFLVTLLNSCKEWTVLLTKREKKTFFLYTISQSRFYGDHNISLRKTKNEISWQTKFHDQK